MSRSPESLNFGSSGDHQHLDLSAPADLLDRSYNSTSYNGNNNTSSSKAVLAALRALQDKIRRLESERTQALDETVQLRHQLKNQEVEAEHAKQREQLQAQKSLQEVRGAYERLLTDKSDLEVRLSKYEEKNKQAQGNVDELQAKIRLLEDDKHNGTMKLKDIEHQRVQIETQIKLAQQKEEEMAQSMVWETKRHEETIAFNQRRIQSLQDELAGLCQDKGMADAKLMELDQLVAQLLAVNESLVAQLTGKPLKHEVRVKAKKAKKKSAPLPRAANLTTVSTDAARVKKFAARHQHLVEAQNEDVEALTSMHKMYANIAKSIKRGGASPARSTASRKSTAASTPGSVVSGKGKLLTRVSRKKAQLIEQFNEEARHSLSRIDPSHVPSSYSQSEFRSQSAPSTARGQSLTPRGSMEVRLPKPSSSYDGNNESHLNVSGEFEDYYQRNNALQGSFLNHTHAPGSAHVSFTHAGDMSPVVSQHHPHLSQNHHVHNYPADYPNEADFTTGLPPRASHSSHSSFSAPQPGSRSDMKNVIDSLEQEFDQLNIEYRKLLSNVQSGSDNGGIGLNKEIPIVTPESIQAQAEEIVNVIQKLHKKGEQIRTLKSSP